MPEQKQTKAIKNTSKSRRSNKIIVGVVVMAFLAVSLGFLGGWLGAKNQLQNSSGNASVSQKVLIDQSQLIGDIVGKVGPSVVSINVSSEVQQQSFFGTQVGQQRSAGTGIIISKDGVVLTNRHLVPSKDSDISIVLSDGTTLDDVEVIGRTNDGDSLDVAFLKIKDSKGKELTPATLADSSKVRVGDSVVAIGNALGQFQNTVTSGIISGYGRTIEAGDDTSSETLQNLFQTDAAINQGNSGGPLVNVNSEVIGLNTAVAGSGAQNIGFSIPINDIQGLIKSVLNTGKLERPYLGVRYVSVNDEYAYQYNLPVKRGAYLAPGRGADTVISGSPAEKAGLQEKDIIVKIDGTSVDENNSLTSLIGRKSVGDEVTLTVIRDGQEVTIKAKLEAVPQQ